MKQTEIQHRSVGSFDDIAALGEAMLKLFDRYKVRASEGSDVRTMAVNARRVAGVAKEKARTLTDEENGLIWDLLTVQRIAPAILALDGQKGAKKLLEKLATGPLGMKTRGRSVAKDTFWEVEIWFRAKRGGLTAFLDEPDVMWEDKAEKMGVACKKVYSEKNLKDRLFKATSQIQNHTKFGFAAFNIDESVEADKLLVVKKAQDVTPTLDPINTEFLERHQPDFLEQFEKSRISGAIVSISCLVVVESENLYYLGNQWTVWTHPSLSEDHKRRIETFKDALQNAGTA